MTRRLAWANAELAASRTAHAKKQRRQNNFQLPIADCRFEKIANAVCLCACAGKLTQDIVRAGPKSLAHR
jgi:hypothetical protein